MSETIVLGSGGLIQDVPENRELLERIKETRPLPRATLIRIAESFKTYPTSALVAQHLDLVALAQEQGEETESQVFTEYSIWECIPHWIKGQPWTVTDRIRLEIRSIPTSVVELLIETLILSRANDTSIYNFVIGVTPGLERVRE
jgi:hypothetical protein